MPRDFIAKREVRMERFLIIDSNNNFVSLDELDDDFIENMDELVMECEVIDLQDMKYYRPCGWLDIE